MVAMEMKRLARSWTVGTDAKIVGAWGNYAII